VANLFRILHTQFYQNRLSFAGRYDKKLWLTFFLVHGVRVRTGIFLIINAFLNYVVFKKINIFLSINIFLYKTEAEVR